MLVDFSILSIPIKFDLTPWTLFGFLGEATFGARFFVQWIASERKGQCHVPVIFWYLSLIGGIIITIYAIGRKDIVFTLGNGPIVFIYLRNLMLIKKEKAQLKRNMETIQVHADPKSDH